jgi:lipid II:glycine glycyltransferase (peptidoglycan interpeptide bridge formation enzyme)
MDIRSAESTDRGAWTAFVASRPEGDVLQSWAWGEAGEGEPGERWSRLMVVDGARRVRGVAQVLARSSAFGRTVLYAPHGPLWDRSATDAAEVLAHLMTGLRAHARERRGIVLKLDPRSTLGSPAGESLSRALASGGARRAAHDLQAPTTRVIDLARGDDPLATWSKEARAEARRAEREGTRVTVDRDGEAWALDAFDTLYVATGRRGGFRVRSRRFLAALAAPLAASGDWFLVLAWHGDEPLAGAIVPRTGERAFYLYAASTRDPRLISKRGPYAVMAGLQRSLKEAGTRTLDLWGVREPDDASVDPAWEGFSLFKRRFGGATLRHPGTFDLVVDPTWDRVRELRERLLGRRR